MKIDINEIREMLIEPGYVSEEEFNNSLELANTNQVNVVDVMIERGLIKEHEFGQLYAQKINIPFINLGEEKIDDAVLNLIPEPVARARMIIVFSCDKDGSKVAMSNPHDLEMRNAISKKLGSPIKFFYATESDIKKALWQYKLSLRDELQKIAENFDADSQDTNENDSRIVSLVDTLLMYAHNSRASDLHLEPYIHKMVVRFRIDGVMHRVATLDKELLPFILTRIKILAKMRIDEHRSAQDGKFQFLVNNENIDVRVSIVPVSGGENAVLRLLSKSNQLINLDNLGFSTHDLKEIKNAIKNPHGMILVTGPTGSGKTTTVYEMVKQLNTDKVHIASIEDPVEYNVEGISQIQVDEKKKLDFANGLRAIVRQDPDIIMVGEIRDKETAEIAINSAMTGHLVFSTLHTNNAATALPRLIDMEIEPFLIASTVNMIVAQRLLRFLCVKCRHTYVISQEEIDLIELIPGLRDYIEEKYQKKLDKITWFKGAGCKVCSESGFSGRLGIYEVLKIDDNIKKLILNRASSDEIMDMAQKNGTTTMLRDGVDKAINGYTTIGEVLRVIME